MLIAIEGIDGSGKGTQAALLKSRLMSEGYRSELISFPQYSRTHFGRTIGRFLNGEFGRLDQVDPHLAAALFAGDRFESLETLQELLRTCDVVVSDRYVASNMAHQGAKRTGDARAALQQWIEHLEYRVYRLPVADLTVHLDVPAETAQLLVARKSTRDYTDKAADIQEADCAYLAAVREAYLAVSATQENWQRVSLMDGGRLRSIEEVADEVWMTVRTRLPARPV